MLSFKKKILAGLIIAGITFGLIVVINVLSMLGEGQQLSRSLDLNMTEVLFKMRGPLPADSNIVIVAIDEPSFQVLKKRWPWSPALHAQLVDSLAAKGAKSIVFDIAFSESSDDLYPKADSVFAASISRAGNVIIPAKFESLRNPDSGDLEEIFTPPITCIRDSAYALGITNMTNEADGTIQRFLYPPSASFLGITYPMISLSAVGGFLNIHPQQETVALLKAVGLEKGYQYSRHINFAGPAYSFKTISYYKILDGSVPTADLQGKIMLIGATILEMHDYKPTPFSTNTHPNMAGVEIHANIAATLLSQNYISTLPGKYRLWITFLMATLTAILAMLFRPLVGGVLSVILLAAYFGLSIILFIYGHLILPVAPVLIAVPLAFTLDTVYKYRTVERSRRQVKHLLGRYVSTEVANEMLRNPELMQLGGVRKEATLLFSDIRGFTKMSEELSPEEVVSVLNIYFDLMTRIISKHHGRVDKYMGDGLMVTFGIPIPRKNHAELAVLAAIDMQDEMRSLNAHLKKRLKKPLKIGIGINTGSVIAGNIGSEIKTDYTAIGDPVNVTSRLENMTKTLGANIIISETTYKELGNKFLTRDLGMHKIRGKSGEFHLYQVLLEKMNRKLDKVERDLHYETF